MTTLAELRQASLKEQKQKEEANRPAETAPATVPVESAADPVPKPAAHKDVPPPVSTAVIANGNGHHAPLPAAVPLKAPVPEPVHAPPTPSPESIKAEKFFIQIHETLSHKTLHPSGAKVSADMPPALFHRAKRYCLDHGNITLRQVLIDLLTTYLQEEGY